MLRYDRRPKVDGADVPLRAQAADARAAADALWARVPGVPVIGWGFSQGAWAAALTAAEYPDAVAALVVVSCSGVSPAEQLRRHGYGDADLRELTATRAAPGRRHRRRAAGLPRSTGATTRLVGGAWA